MVTLKKYDVDPILPWRPVSELALSPTKKDILFTRTITDDEKNKYKSNIWIISILNSTIKQFTSGNGNDSNPMWSPNCDTIYFLSNRKTMEEEEEKTRLWTISYHGGEAQLVAEAKHSIEGAKLAPDGKKILFFSNVEEESEAREDSNETDVLWINKLIYKRDGERKFIPYTRKHLFISSVLNGEPKQITSGPFDIVSADWSPDGSKVAYVTNAEDYDGSNIRDVYIVSLDGGSPRKITNGQIMVSTVSWSPNDKYLAYTGYQPFGENYRGWRNTNIWIISSEGKDPINITANFDITINTNIRAPIWSYDSKIIYFIGPNYGATNVYRVNIDNRKVEQVIEGRQSLTFFDISKDGSLIAFVSSEPTVPYEIWIHDMEGNRKLSNFSEEFVKNLEFSNPEEFWFEASDGVKNQGWIMKPIGFNGNEMYPTIIDVHGGPMGFHGYSFNHDFQVLAHHGYVVVYTNPRMSTGYGEKFAAECCGHYGEKDYSDIMEAVDYVIKNYDYIDPKKLGVQGHSYGGFMMNWIVGHTHRFKACVSMASISNWDSFFGVSDIGTYWVPWQIGFGKDPWEDRNLHVEKSPFTYVDNVDTPILFMHPEKDFRCPLDQSEQMYVALKKRGVETELIIFPDEHHLLPFSGKPNHRREWLRHKLRWFEKYLK